MIVKNKLKTLETYELVLTDGYARLKVNAPHSKIWLDEKFAGSNSFVFNLKEGNYILKITRDKYYDGEIPARGELNGQDQEVLDKLAKAPGVIGEKIEKYRFKSELNPEHNDLLL